MPINLKDLPVKPPKILLWGPPGSGKTAFATSYGKGMLVIDCDDGIRTAVTLKDQWHASRQDILVEQCLERDPTRAMAYNKVTDVVRGLTTLCASGKTPPYDCLLIDSFTRLSEFACRQIFGNSGALLTPLKTTQAMWGIAITELTNLFTYIQALPIPVIVIFHDRIGDTVNIVDANGKVVPGEPEKEISIFGKNLPGQIIAAFDEVLYQRVRVVSGRVEPYLTTTPSASYVVRTRNQIKDGTLTSIGMRELLRQLDWKKEISP